jgi:hypothetical protein
MTDAELERYIDEHPEGMDRLMEALWTERLNLANGLNRCEFEEEDGERFDGMG